TSEMPPDPPGQALEAGRNRRQVIRVLLAQPCGRSDGQAVPGQDDGLLDVDDPGDQVVEEPVKFAGQAHVSPFPCPDPARGDHSSVRSSPSLLGSALCAVSNDGTGAPEM